jgi:hypothetical protein
MLTPIYIALAGPVREGVICGDGWKTPAYPVMFWPLVE